MMSGMPDVSCSMGAGQVSPDLTPSFKLDCKERFAGLTVKKGDVASGTGSGHVVFQTVIFKLVSLVWKGYEHAFSRVVASLIPFEGVLP
jgi:hypothetical protein